MEAFHWFPVILALRAHSSESSHSTPRELRFTCLMWRWRFLLSVCLVFCSNVSDNYPRLVGSRTAPLDQLRGKSDWWRNSSRRSVAL